MKPAGRTRGLTITRYIEPAIAGSPVTPTALGVSPLRLGL